MKQNELSPFEKLEVAFQSHKFYHHQCADLEKKLSTSIDKIFQSNEDMPSKKDCSKTIEMVKKLLTLSNKYIQETTTIINQLDELPKEEKQQKKEFIKAMKIQLLSLGKRQSSIHARVEEIKAMIVEMYDMDGNGDEWKSGR